MDHLLSVTLLLCGIVLSNWWQQDRTKLVISCGVNDKQSCSQSNIIYSVELCCSWELQNNSQGKLKATTFHKASQQCWFPPWIPHPFGPKVKLQVIPNFGHGGVWWQMDVIHCKMMKLSPTAKRAPLLRMSVQQYILWDYKDYVQRQIILKFNPASRAKIKR